MRNLLLLLLPFAAFAQTPVQEAAEAARKGNVTALKTLLRKTGVSPSAQKDGTPLIFFSKNLRTARFLFNEGASPTGPKGETMAMLAAGMGDKKMMLFFLKHNNARARDSQNWTALHYLAAGSGKPALAKFLLQHGADINAADDSLWTPLMHAAYRGNIPLTALLLEEGADTTPRNRDKKTALSLAREPLPFALKTKDYLEVIRLLREANAP